MCGLWGVANGLLAYAGKTASGDYSPFYFNRGLMVGDIAFSDEVFIIPKETAEAYQKAKAAPAAAPPQSTQSPTAPGMTPPEPGTPPTDATGGQASGTPPAGKTPPAGFEWSGEIPTQKWMNFYTKVLAKVASSSGLRVSLKVQVTPPDRVTQQKMEERQASPRELGLEDGLKAL